MITIKDWMEGVKYRVTDNWDFQWQCFGSNAVGLTSEWGAQGGRDYTVVYDPTTMEVFEVCSYSNKDCTALRWIHPKYKAAYLAEDRLRGMGNIFDFQDVKFTEVKSPGGWAWLTKMFGF
jgi:hypothetical protein